MLWSRRFDGRCAFCKRRKPNSDLVKGRGRRAIICHDCLRLAAELLDSDAMPSPTEPSGLGSSPAVVRRDERSQ
jgi:hypothetical protein